MNDAGAASRLALREIPANDAAGLRTIGKLHMELLDYGPMAGLGEDFVREVCYRAHMADGVLRVWLAEWQGEPVGFVAVTPYSQHFHRSGMRNHAVGAAWALCKALLQRPARLLALARALRVLGSRRGELERDLSGMGEVVCIAVRPQYLTQKFARESGVRPSVALVRSSAEYLRRAGVEQMRMLVDADNRPVQLLYHMLGASFRDYSLGGEPMIEVTFDLRDGRLAPAPDVPPVWTAEPAAAGAEGWRGYWEGINDDARVFSIEARDYAERFARNVQVGGHESLLDFGCGFGFTGELLARQVGRVHLWDGSSSVRQRARARVAHLGNVDFIDLGGAPEALQTRFDIIVVHSVVQYMSEDELRSWLLRWRSWLTPGTGRLVLSDLMQPQTQARAELIGYLLFSLRQHFFADAVAKGFAEARRYRQALDARPLTRLPPPRLESLASEAGLSVEWLPENLSYRSSRRTAVLRAVAAQR